MSEMTGLEKLRVLLPHWMEHNETHIADFRKWEVVARREVGDEAADLINNAIASMRETGKTLATALEKIGGPNSGGHHHHHG